MSWIRFIVEGVKNFKEIGAVARTGKSSCAKMVSYIQKEDRYVVELGAGDGVITRHILETMSPDATLLAFEINPTFCAKLEALDDPRLIVVNDSAEHIEKYLSEHGIREVDIMISAIPFLVLPYELAHTIVHAGARCIKKGGSYVQLHYGKTLSPLYKEVYGNFSTDFILNNIPPSYIYRCIKKTDSSNND